eukprot:COSAG01_NODE_3642_length_5836_cov_6.885132_5_plen_269_part_00
MGVQKECTYALSHLASHEAVEYEELLESQHAIVAGGGLKLIASALRTHPQERGLQRYAKEALDALAQLSEPANRWRLGVSRACQDMAEACEVGTVLELMRAHGTEDRHVASLGSEAVGTLALWDRQRAELIRLGGIEVVVAALRAHPTEAAVQEMGCALSLVHARALGALSAEGTSAFDLTRRAAAAAAAGCTPSRRRWHGRHGARQPDGGRPRHHTHDLPGGGHRPGRGGARGPPPARRGAGARCVQCAPRRPAPRRPAPPRADEMR